MDEIFFQISQTWQSKEVQTEDLHKEKDTEPWI